ncbi:MAG: methylthioribulose 1-phosphate dehydratase [Candidatus Caenarcaniphilales bacterium]|nr:methylthioribulose 1-phosphate dehydratase [Candidatus Caenarcaniphilales bacterium]
MNNLAYLPQRELVCDLCKKFYAKGWASGTGGGVSIRVDDSNYLIAPSGVQKEEIESKDLFVIELIDCGYKIIEKPENLKISACTDIFVNIYKKRKEVGAIIHSHSINSVLLTKIVNGDHVTISKYEMLKGLEGCNYFGSHTIPILNNVENECDLADSVAEVVEKYPLSHAVLVRDHGVYIWGRNWERAKVHAECYDYLFEAFIKEKQLMNIISLKN